VKKRKFFTTSYFTNVLRSKYLFLRQVKTTYLVQFSTTNRTQQSARKTDKLAGNYSQKTGRRAKRFKSTMAPSKILITINQMELKKTNNTTINLTFGAITIIDLNDSIVNIELDIEVQK
jgi:hypothetical protein